MGSLAEVWVSFFCFWLAYLGSYWMRLGICGVESISAPIRVVSSMAVSRGFFLRFLWIYGRYLPLASLYTVGELRGWGVWLPWLLLSISCLFLAAFRSTALSIGAIVFSCLF